MSFDSLDAIKDLDIYGLVHGTFEKAYANHDLVYSPNDNSETIDDKEAGMTWVVSIVDGLAQRPQNRPTEPGSNEEQTSDKVAETRKKDPFVKPEPELLIADNVLGDYRLILNKFPNSEDHFLLVTKEFVPQDSLLKPAEIQLIDVILHNLNSSPELKKTGSRFFAFFNSGPESGYSQFHKHMQFLKLPAHMPVYQSQLVATSDFFLPREVNLKKHPLFNKKATFKHFILKLKEEGYKNEEEQEMLLMMLYIYLVRRCMNTFVEEGIGREKFSYNFMMMDDWMMIVPRRHAHFETVWQNSLGYMGLFSAKNEEVRKKMTDIGFMNILEGCGFAQDEEEEKVIYNEYSY